MHKYVFKVPHLENLHQFLTPLQLFVSIKCCTLEKGYFQNSSSLLTLNRWANASYTLCHLVQSDFIISVNSSSINWLRTVELLLDISIFFVFTLLDDLLKIRKRSSTFLQSETNSSNYAKCTISSLWEERFMASKIQLDCMPYKGTFKSWQSTN